MHPVRGGDLALFAALLACGAICIEATRRLSQPTGVSRDLLSAWWLPIALLLPPVYALIAPIVLGTLLYLRVRRTPAYRRLFSSAALGLAGASASMTFRHLGPTAAAAQSVPWLAHAAAHAWFLRPTAVLAALGSAALFNVLNTGIVAVAAHAAQPQARWAEVLWDQESLLLDLTEICVGVLVVVSCALSPLLLLVALPPVIVLQRSLMHQQLQAAARTDAKTGLLNATAWQREADTEIARALQAGRASPCCWPTSTISSGSTTPTGTWRATRCCAGWPPSCASRCGARTWWAGSAARSSWCCCRGPTPTRRSRSPSGSGTGPA